jgi:hypothetical protein
MAENLVKIELLVVLFIAIALIAVIGLTKPQTEASDNNAHASIVITENSVNAQPTGGAESSLTVFKTALTTKPQNKIK